MAAARKSDFDLVINAGEKDKNYWKDLLAYRDLFYILSWRDLKVRYKQTAIGAIWAFLRPLLTMLIFTIVFGKVAKLPSQGNAPYSILVFSAMLPWHFFSSSLSEASNSLIGNTNLITKVYFPRIIIPFSTIVVSLVDFIISFIVLLVMMFVLGFIPTIKFIFLPYFLLIAFAAAFGIGLYLSALNVKFRDFRYIVPFIVQIGLYISPVGFSSEIVPDKWKYIFSLNPMVGVIDGFRWCIIGSGSLNLQVQFLSLSVTLFFLIVGLRYFRKTEKSFADNI